MRKNFLIIFLAFIIITGLSIIVFDVAFNHATQTETVDLDKHLQGEYGPYVSHRYCYYCGEKLTELDDFAQCPRCNTKLDYDKIINSEVILKYLEEVNK